ncbi:beta-defensin 126 [Rhinolophus ferrumequinum]|uniref:beta-defensin 126 n=1 Tax=Rhinolophus ferrumequinum TaxID=59479 RepID=UPI00140FD70E|nr:beta-defensin 126 [Rhinolophus ferrumequinum]
MKSLLFTLATFLLLAQLVSGDFFIKKCANRYGNCRKKCKTGEIHIKPPTSMCSKQTMCCILSGKELYPLICGNYSNTATTVGVPKTMTATTVGVPKTMTATTVGVPKTMTATTVGVPKPMTTKMGKTSRPATWVAINLTKNMAASTTVKKIRGAARPNS